MLDRMTFDRRWRETPPDDRLKFIADQVFDQSLSLIEIKTTLINHAGRLIGLERHKGNNPGKASKSHSQNRERNLGVLIGAIVAGAIAGAVVVLKWLGLIK